MRANFQILVSEDASTDFGFYSFIFGFITGENSGELKAKNRFQTRTLFTSIRIFEMKTASTVDLYLDYKCKKSC